MNIVVLSPKNRGTGVTAIAHALAIEIKHRGEFVQLIDVNANRPSLLEMYRSIPKHKGEAVEGMTALTQLIRTGTVNPEDLSNCAIDLGVDTVCVTPNITLQEIMEIIGLTKNCQIEGRNFYTVIDLNTSDSSSDLFKHCLQNADVCVFVMTQDIEHINNIKNCHQLNDKALHDHGISTVYVVNRFEECALSMKDIWNSMDVKSDKNWFKVRYNKHILQVKSKALYDAFSKALHDSNDPDIATTKADISRIAGYALNRR